jgi:hypothetical protein
MKNYISLFFLFPTLLTAQRNFQDGYIVTLNGDTVFGKVNYQEWNFTPKAILFKPANSSTNQKYDVANTSYFEITGKESYKRFVTRVSLSPEKLEDLQSRDTTSRQDTIFMQVIYTGTPFILLRYADVLKERFYLLEQGKEQPYELIKRDYYVDVERTKTFAENLYRQQLTAALFAAGRNTDQRATSQINSVSYEEKELKKIVAYIDGANSQAIQDIASSQQNIRLFVGGGIQQTNVSIVGEQFFATGGYSQKSSFLPAISAGVDLISKPNVGKLLFRLKAGYRTVKSVTTSKGFGNNRVSTYELSSIIFSLHPHIIYNIYNKSNFKVPVGLAFGYVLNNYSKNRLSNTYPNNPSTTPIVRENYFMLHKGYVSPQVHAGVVLQNKFEISGLYQLPVNIANYSAFGIRNSLVQLEVLYLFKKRY